MGIVEFEIAKAQHILPWPEPIRFNPEGFLLGRTDGGVRCVTSEPNPYAVQGLAGHGHGRY